MQRKIPLAALLLSLTAVAQTATPVWFTVVPSASQAANLSVVMPAGTTYRFGDTKDNKWSAPITTTVSGPVSDFDAGALDPDVGVAKELDIQEGTATIAVTIVNSTTGTTTPVQVPALPVVPPVITPPVTAPTIVAKYNCLVDFMSDGTFSSETCTPVTQ
jgi:hypothetical protein